MHPFIERFSNVLTAVLHGADRIVMKGAFRPLQYADGAMAFFQRIGVRYKDA